MKILMGLILTLMFGTLVNAQVPENLVGKWFEGSTSILSEKNMTDGTIASKYGSSIGYTIEADGTFRYAALMKSTMYGCTTSLWNDRRGKISVAGDVITFTPNKDYWFNSNSCYPSSNKEQNKPLKTVQYNYEVGQKEGKTWLCMREVGKTKTEDIRCFPQTND
jgi:hypothetical protein